MVYNDLLTFEKQCTIQDGCYNNRGAPSFFGRYSRQELFTVLENYVWRKMQVLLDVQSHDLNVSQNNIATQYSKSDGLGSRGSII